jgi:hypothetical protein
MPPLQENVAFAGFHTLLNQRNQPVVSAHGMAVATAAGPELYP